jgi:hypothetical protein
MKTFFYILLSCLLFSSCAKKETKKEEFKIVTIEYTNIINGYLVKVYWKPNAAKIEHIQGPAIIEFYNKVDSTSFTISNNYFSILKSKLLDKYSEDSLGGVAFNQNNIQLTYDEVKFDTNNFGSTNVPFFFMDLDFDKNKELIIAEVQNGQRMLTSFKVYQFADGYIQADLFGTTYQEPYISLDERTKIDTLNKTITLNLSGGGCGSITKVYKLNTTSNGYENKKMFLETFIEQQYDESSSKCFALEYKVNKLSKQLVSKKEVK